MRAYLKNSDKIQILGGSDSIQGDGLDYAESILVYKKNISDDELKNIIGDLKVKISWKNVFNKNENRILYMKDYLK